MGGVNNYVKTHSRKHTKHGSNKNHVYVPKKHKEHQSHAHVSHEHPTGENSLDDYLRKHTSLSHTGSRNDDEDAIKEAAKEELQEAGRIAEAKVQEAKEKASWEDKLNKMNPFDGTVHNPDGSRQFPDKEVVGGVNNYASIRSHRSSRAQMDSFESELEDNSS